MSKITFFFRSSNLWSENIGSWAPESCPIIGNILNLESKYYIWVEEYLFQPPWQTCFCVNCGKWCVPLIEREIWNLLAFPEPQSLFICLLLLLIIMIMMIVLSHLWSSGNMRIYRLQWTSLPLNDQTPSHHLSCLSILHRDHKTQSTLSWSSLHCPMESW